LHAPQNFKNGREERTPRLPTIRNNVKEKHLLPFPQTQEREGMGKGGEASD
jgi:hypothetical protein